jgi:hypothetical protein
MKNDNDEDDQEMMANEKENLNFFVHTAEGKKIDNYFIPTLI